jgi:L-lactate dehydrogenase complex protein LldG
MTPSRDAMLAAIRQGLKRGPLAPEKAAELDRHIAFPVPRLIPARGRIDRAAREALFIAEAERVGATTERVAGPAAVAAATAGYLERNNLGGAIKAADDPLLREIPWTEQPRLEVAFGAATGADHVGLTGAFAAVAETGTLVLASGPASPGTLCFLPDVHLVVLPAGRIVGTYEEAWLRLRARGAGFMPRAVSWITGPSRTADIEQTLLMGAHGPRSLHVIVVDEGA